MCGEEIFWDIEFFLYISTRSHAFTALAGLVAIRQGVYL